MHLRPAHADPDAAVMQALFDASYVLPIPNAQRVLSSQHVRVAETDDGTFAGFYALWPSGFVWIAVLADQRRRGVGRLLLEDALEQASTSGLTELTSKVGESNSAANAFCARFHFKPYVHAVNLSLDVTTWDEAALIPKWVQAQEQGILFITFAEIGNDVVHQRKLYELNKRLSATIPRDQPQEFAPFETWVERRLSAQIMPHEAIWIALDGDEWIGMTQVSLEDGYSFNQMTGVLPEYRGRGIAHALKLLSLRFVRQNRGIIHTFNDVGNYPMIAVNEDAGFRQGERFYLVRRKPLVQTQ